MRRNNRLGCLTAGGIFGALLAVILAGIASANSGGAMFSPGKLYGQTGEDQLEGVWSHAEIEKCSTCHHSPLTTMTMSLLCADCHSGILDDFNDPTSIHGVIVLNGQILNCMDCHTDHKGTGAQISFFGKGHNLVHEVVGYYLFGHTKMSDGSSFKCEGCHGGNISVFEVSYCINCHYDIEPEQVLSHINDFGDKCLSCHDGIDTYGSDFNHDDLVFRLEGGHAGIACGDCHKDKATLVDLKITPQRCVDCHEEDDEHNFVFGDDCGVCHNPVGWDQVDFDHSKSGFPLNGKHVIVECEKCHVTSIYESVSAECAACHSDADTHNGQFGRDCSTCHTPDDWLQVFFEHEGAQVLDCVECHNDDPPQYHYLGQCSACHNTTDWLPASFDHSVGSVTDCISCHIQDKPDNHFTGQCSDCHKTTTWEGAEYAHTFPINHKGAKGECQTCHPAVYTTYICYNCHAHDQAKIVKKHKKIANYTDCMRCHWDGKEHDDDD